MGASNADYERQFKEIVAKAKAAYGTGAYDDSTLEFLIPGLRESEDERIRKLLVWQVYRNIEDETNDLAQSVYDGIKGHDPDLEESIEDWKKCLAYLEKQKENPKSADSIPSDCVSDAKCEDRWHKVGDSLPDNPREVLCKDEAGNYFIGRYYVGEGWEISNYDDEDKPHHLNPPVSKWIDFPPEKQEEQKPIQTPEEKEYIRTLKSLISDFIRDKQPEDVAFYQKIYDWLDERHIEQEPISEVFGFKVGDAVRLKDGDGRKHIIKSFEEVGGIHGPNFYHVEFEDNSARDGIYPGEEYPNGYSTQMEKFEEEQKPAEGKEYSSPECGTTAGVWSEDFDKEVEKIHKRYPEVSFAKLTRIAYHFSKWANRCKDKEWSEEEKDKVAQYLHDRDGGMIWSKATEITEDILDILRPRPKAELTLLDENIIKAAVAFVEQNDHFNVWGGIDKHTVIKSLRSLCPSWKPSEEQMTAIIRAWGILKLHEQEDVAKRLAKLYEQLKKLM